MSICNLNVNSFICHAMMLFFVTCVGCGSSSEVERTHVRGTVSLNGDEVASGFIEFIPVAGVTFGAPVQLKIKDGSFDSRSGQRDTRGVVVGTNGVKIYQYHRTGKMIKGMDGMEPEELQLIPEKFNEKSELISVIEENTEELKFDLTD